MEKVDMVAVNKQDVSAVIALMRNYMRTANDTHLDATYVKITKARGDLRRAQGIHEALQVLDLLPGNDRSGEDLSRIETKIEDIYEQKHRREYPRWRASV